MPASPEAAAFKAEADVLFRAGEYQRAADRYCEATALDDSDPVYFSNLAAAYLKLNKFGDAVDAAHSALVKDPRSFKARYRRAMGRKGLQLFPECLLDLASALTTEPGHADAAREFDLVEAICLQERRLMSSRDITAADFPPAFGSESRRPDQTLTLHENTLLDSRSPAPQKLSTSDHLEICYTCRKKKPRKEIKMCRKCMAIKYCSVECQRADWPEHRTSCKLPHDNHVTMRLGRAMSQHPYFFAHLMLYSLRAMGITTRPTNYHKFILLVIVEMVPVASPVPPGMPSTRLSIRQMLSVPIHIIPDKPRNEYIELVNQLQLKHPGDALYGYWITTNAVYAQGDDWRYRMWVSPVAQQLMRAFQADPRYIIPMESLSRGTEQHLSLNLGSLFQNMEDELILDVHNRYQLRA
ncbi:hypothetical protein FB451DRAFT_1556817 [Mycena latifolia]|nr:hypothetical protein FB451DRAFT_1556817 [Mycena latifolia]